MDGIAPSTGALAAFQAVEASGSACTFQAFASRRGVLAGAAAVSALAFAPVMPASAGIARADAPRRAIFEQHAEQSLAFAQRARAQGLPALGFAGDMSGLWFDQLLPALRKDGAPLMGLTSTDALFCFEHLAWDVGMRVRLRVDHVRGPGGFQHLASAELPPSVISRLRADDAAFGSTAAELALDCRGAWGDCTHAPVAGPAALATWVIAPLDLA